MLGLPKTSKFVSGLVAFSQIPSMIFIEWPNLLFWLTFHVSLANCHLRLEKLYDESIKHFMTQQDKTCTSTGNTKLSASINSNYNYNSSTSTGDDITVASINHDSILNSNFVTEYIKICGINDKKCNEFEAFAILLISMAIFSAWFSIAYWIQVVTGYWERDKAITMFWAIFWTLRAIYASCVVYGAVYPGILWTQFFHEKIVRQCHETIEILFENKRILNQSIIANKRDIESYGKQQACIEKINRFIRILHEKPNVYTILGAQIDHQSVKVVVLGFVVGKLLSLMWNTVHLE